MIGAVQVEIAGKRRELRFTTRAQARVEKTFGAAIASIMSNFGKDYGIGAAAEILAASWNSGRGVDINVAYDAIDEVGQERAFEIVGDVVKAAYPEAEDEAEAELDLLDSGNGKKAPKS